MAHHTQDRQPYTEKNDFGPLEQNELTIALRLISEMRNPLTAIKLYSDLLMMKPDQHLKDLETFAQTILDETNRLETFLDQFHSLLTSPSACIQGGLEELMTEEDGPAAMNHLPKTKVKW